MNIQCEPIYDKPSYPVMRQCAMCGDYFDSRELNGEKLCNRCAEYRSRLAEYHNSIS